MDQSYHTLMETLDALLSGLPVSTVEATKQRVHQAIAAAKDSPPTPTEGERPIRALSKQEVAAILERQRKLALY